MSTVKSIVLARRPVDRIVTGETFRTEIKPAPKASDLKDGEVIVDTLYLSLDPAMRWWLVIAIGDIMRGYSIGVISASKSSKFAMGEYVTVTTGWTEQAVMSDKALSKVHVPKGGKLTDALGVLGTTGLTAYHGLIDVGRVKQGDFVVVSGAAGATGSVVCQIAKLKGARVLGIAGSAAKCAWLRELGCDAALNYKDAEFAAEFKTATEAFIDLYWDNVGGEILDLALARAKPHARFVMCGGISQYNSRDVRAPKNYLNIVSQRIRMEGFIVMDYAAEWPKSLRQLAQWMEEGKIKSQETIVKGGLESAEKGLAQLFSGGNMGKMLVEVKTPPRALL